MRTDGDVRCVVSGAFVVETIETDICEVLGGDLIKLRIGDSAQFTRTVYVIGGGLSLGSRRQEFTWPNLIQDGT